MAATIRDNQTAIDFVGETTAQRGPYQARGPLGLRLADGHGGSVKIKLFAGDDFADSTDLTFTGGAVEKISLAAGEQFMVEFDGCTDANATVVFYASAEQ